MKRVTLITTIVTLYAVFYQLTPVLGFSEKVIYSMFMISPFLVGWMAYNIIRYGKPSERSFNDYFYDDWDYKRNGKEELNESQSQ